ARGALGGAAGPCSWSTSTWVGNSGGPRRSPRPGCRCRCGSGLLVLRDLLVLGGLLVLRGLLLCDLLRALLLGELVRVALVDDTEELLGGAAGAGGPENQLAD